MDGGGWNSVQSMENNVLRQYVIVLNHSLIFAFRFAMLIETEALEACFSSTSKLHDRMLFFRAGDSTSNYDISIHRANQRKARTKRYFAAQNL